MYNVNRFTIERFSVFINRCSLLAKKGAYLGFFTPFVWMFIQSYEKLREFICNNKTIETLIQFEYSAFEEATVPVCIFTFRNSYMNKKGCYIRLTDFCGGMEMQRKKTLEAIVDHNCGYYFEKSTNNLSKIPGSPIAYWVSESVVRDFEHSTRIEDISETRIGMATASNDLFMRLWHEINLKKLGLTLSSREEAQLSNLKWYPYCKGGAYRKWYGNMEYVVNWENDGFEIQNFRDERTGRVRSHNYNLEYIFKLGLTFTAISSSNFACRTMSNSLFGSGGSGICKINEADRKYLLGLLNSKIVEYLLGCLSATMNFEVNTVGMLPYILGEQKEIVDEYVESAILIAKKDWDSFETSWDFTQHPLIHCATFSKQEMEQGKKKHIKDINHIKDVFVNWEKDCNLRFETLKRNEEELNRIFIDIYGLQDELIPEVEDKDVTVRKADLQRDIRSLISYAVGCMFGRYSLDKEGLIFAGGRMEDKFSYYGGTFADTQDYQLDGKYTLGELGSKFYYIPIEGKKALECWKVDADNIIPITDDEYFEDDIVEKFITFIRTVYGKQTLEENLKFIADALGGKGQPREVIRNYFLNDFYKDHCKIYQKRPIYWLFDSGKKNGFKCLIYMHRYEPDTIARIRTDYVHEQQSRYRTAIADLEQRIVNAGTSERVKLNKSLKKIQEQADELHTYEERIHHLADQMIAIDLDDGVKHNYEIFKDVLAKIK